MRDAGYCFSTLSCPLVWYCNCLFGGWRIQAHHFYWFVDIRFGTTFLSTKRSLIACKSLRASSSKVSKHFPLNLGKIRLSFSFSDTKHSLTLLSCSGHVALSNLFKYKTPNCVSKCSSHIIYGFFLVTNSIKSTFFIYFTFLVLVFLSCAFKAIGCESRPWIKDFNALFKCILPVLTRFLNGFTSALSCLIATIHSSLFIAFEDVSLKFFCNLQDSPSRWGSFLNHSFNFKWPFLEQFLEDEFPCRFWKQFVWPCLVLRL